VRIATGTVPDMLLVPAAAVFPDEGRLVVYRRGRRQFDAVPVEIMGNRRVAVRGVTQDLSIGGLFMRTPTLLPVGAGVELLLHVVEPPLRVNAHVVHALQPDEARALGRMPGLGFAFADLDGDRRDLLEGHVARKRAAQMRVTGVSEETMRVVIADGQTRLLERMSLALGRAGFQVVTAASGIEAYGACLTAAPDVLVTDLNLPVIDGIHLLRCLGERPELAEIPVMLMAEEATDLRRLQAYQSGAADFLPKPFTVAELCIRSRRLAAFRHEKSRKTILRGELSKIGFPTLLTLFGHERRSGILTATTSDDVAWICLSDGRVHKARALGAEATSRELLMRILSWCEGQFEFTACDVHVADEVNLGTTQLLLEHARWLDEHPRA